jgi:flagellar motility protein MotE (MotC chaperone)
MILIRSAFAAGVCVAAWLAISPACAQEAAKPRLAPESEIARYCAAIAPSASEARAIYQLRRLSDLHTQVRDAVEKLESKQNEAREWVMKRESMMKSATDDVVAIYAKMAPDAAAPQLAAMDDGVAAAVLSKLKPGVAGAILAEMQAEKAARLSLLIAGAAPGDKS